MLLTMSKSRLVVMVDEEVHGALRIEAGTTGKDMGEILETLVRQHLAESLAHFRKRRKKAKDEKAAQGDEP